MRGAPPKKRNREIQPKRSCCSIRTNGPEHCDQRAWRGVKADGELVCSHRYRQASGARLELVLSSVHGRTDCTAKVLVIGLQPRAGSFNRLKHARRERGLNQRVACGRERCEMAGEAGSPRADWRVGSLAALIYLLVSGFFFARGLIGHPGFFIGRDTYPTATMWFFKWWLFSISHGLNPFVTDWVWAPLGINLAWTTCVPLPSLISVPLQVTVGEPATYNIIAMLLPPLAAFSAFLLCRRVTSAFWPSLLGGYVFGFSSYMLDEILRHLDLVGVFPVPLIFLLTLKKLDGEISERRFAILLGALLTAQFLCFPELFATVTIVGGFALLLAMTLFGSEMRARLAGLIAPITSAYLVAAAVLSPYLYYLFTFGFPHSPIWPASRFSADLAGLFVPRETTGLGGVKLLAAISRNCDFFQNSDYLGIVLIVFIEGFRRRYWSVPVGKFLTILLLVIVIAATGPLLHFCGRPVFPMPWAILGRLPLISIALPMRFMMYAFLVVAVMVAMWFAASAARPLTKCVAAIVILASIR